MNQTLLDKIWQRHRVIDESQDHPAVIYIDLHLIHEVTSPQAFSNIESRDVGVRRPERTLATVDHSIPTTLNREFTDKQAEHQVEQLRANCSKHGIRCFDVDHESQGIVHVIAPELGFTQPGMTIVCGDSHTSTHGAFGALAFGIGTSEVAGVLATQCLLQRKPKNMAVNLNGRLPRGTSAKDVALHVIRELGAAGGTGYVLEYRGPAVSGMSMEARMTLCNMSIEAGARAALIAPDQVTFDYLRGRPNAPQGEAFDQKVLEWQSLASDPDALFDQHIDLDVSRLGPMLTFGTSLDMVVGVGESIPPDADSASLDYMGFCAQSPLTGMQVDVVFIGSCTNGRIEDLRAAAAILQGRQVAAQTRVLVVPGSQAVKRQAEREGLAEVFRSSGAEWREPGCSMCIAMNGDQLERGQLAVSTSNRNFRGRQGPGSRTVLASPATAAATAVSGVISDPRAFLAMEVQV